MKKILLFLLTLMIGFCTLQLSAQQTVEIGTGTSTTSNTPYNSLWGYSFVEQIYTADEINMAGEILSISFNNSSSEQTNNITVYMKLVDRTSFSSTTDYETVTTADIVYTGSHNFSSGWSTITLDSPFDYDGVSNLMIAIHENTSGYSTRYFYYTTATNAAISFHSDSSDPDPYNLGSYGGNKYTSSNRANIRMEIMPNSNNCYAPTSPLISDVDSYEATLSWTPREGQTAWEVYCGTGVIDLDQVTWTAVTDTFYTFTNLTPATNYTAYVRTNCGSEVSNPRQANFTTEATCASVPSSVSVSNITATSVDVNWTGGADDYAWEVVVVPSNATPESGIPEQTTDHPYTVIDLQDNTQYKVYVRTDCGEGDHSYWSNPATFTTQPFCTSPINVNISQIAGTSALVTWEPANFGAISYTVEYSQDSLDNWTMEVVNGTQFMISNLEPSTTYNVMVYSNCDLGTADTVEKTFTSNCLIGGDIAIGNGSTTNSYIPSYSYYNYSYTQQLYTAAELGSATTFNSISFHISTYSEGRNLSIYLKHTNESSVGTGINATGAQLVYTHTGNTPLHQGWNTFTLTTPFEYNGTDNLLVVVIDGTGTYSSPYNYWTGHSASGKSCYVYNDNNSYNINSLPSCSSSSFRANVIFGSTCDNDATCVRPNVYVTETSESSITIDWAPGYTENVWNVEYSANDTDWTSLGSVNTHPYEVTGLDPDTKYYIRVNSNCGSEESGYAKVAARTECSSIELPYAEDFDDAPGSGSGNMITCWTANTNYSSTDYPYTSNSQYHSGNYSVYFYGSSSAYSYLASPRIDDMVAMDNLQVRFWARKSTATYYIQVGIMEDPNDPSTFVQVGTNLTPDTINTWQLLQVNTDNYTGNGQYIAFRIPADITNYMYIDDVNIDYIPMCEHVSDIHTTTVASETADIAWTEGGAEGSWDVVYGISGTITNPDNETATTVQSPNISLTDLNSNTLYDVYVKAVCSGSESSIWMPYTFRTECGVITTIPFTENFDEYNTGSASPIYCWTRHNTYSTTSDYPYVSSSYAVSGTKSLYFYHDGNSYAMIATPAFDQAIDFSNLQVSFMMKASSSSSAKMIVGVMTDPTDPTTFDPIDTVIPTSTDWEPVETPLSSYTGTASHIAIKSLMAGYYSIYVDNFTVEELPSCPKPTHVTAASGASDTVVLSWTSANINQWDIIYGPAGFDPNEDPEEGITLIEGVTDNPYTITELEGGIVYDMYVRSSCGGGDVSPWCTMPASAAPFLVQMGTNGSATISSCGFTVTDDGGLNGTYSNNCDYTLTINPSEPNNLVSISGTFKGEGTIDYLSIYEGTSTSGTLLQKVTSGTSGTLVNFGPLTSESGPLTLLFHSDVSVVYDGFAAQVSCIEMTGCPRPTNFTVNEITSSSISLSWMGPEDASAWNVAYGPTPFTPTEDSPYETVYDTTITIDELTAGTSYDFYVQADCGTEPSAWRGPVSAAPGVFTFGTTGSSSITACDLTIYDNGGPNGNYTAYCDYTLTVYPSDPDSVVSISGTFAGESTVDYLSVYDGTSTSGTLLQKVQSGSGSSGTTVTFGPLTSESGPVTLYFHSDVSVQYAGFAATVSCVEAPDCRTPYGLTANNISADEATITWTAEQGANIELYYKKNSETTWTIVTSSDFTTENSCLLTNLDPATTYNVYVANVCTDTTLTTATITFTTLCTAVTAPYSENFAGFNTAMSPCWERFSGLASTVFNGGAMTPTTSGWNFSSSNVFPIGHPKINIYYTSCNYWLVSPSIDLSQLNAPTLMFSLALTDYGNEDPIEQMGNQADDKFIVAISTDDGATWSAANATVWDNTGSGDYSYDSISTTGEDISISLSQYAGQTIRIAFYGESTVSGGDNDLHIANVMVDEPISCPRPNNVTVSNINSTSGTLSWTAGGDESSWNIAYGAPGFDPNNTSDIVLASSNPFTLTGLNALTSYEVYVQANCGSGETSLWSSYPVSFATAGCDITEQCEYVFVCTDGYGDGWNDAYISVQQNGVPVATVEAINHSMSSTTTVDTIRVMLCDNVSTSIIWHSGEYDDEIDVAVIGPNDSILYSHSDMETITSNTLLTFTTDCSGSGPIVTDPTVTTNAASAITETTATLNATINNPSSVTITACGFEWKAVSDANYTVVTLPSVATAMTHNLTGLTANTNYTYKAFITFNGTTVYGDDENFTTQNGGGETCNVPTNLTATATAYNTADVNWTAGGTETAWNLRYKTGTTDWTTVAVNNTPSYQLTGLNAQTTYEVQVQAVCNSTSSSDWTASASFTTPAEPVEPCDAPTGLTVNNITENTATVTWTPGGNETAWNVQYKLQSASQWQEANVQTTTYLIEGLTANSTYDVRVKAVCAADNQSDFVSTTFTTTGVGIDNITLANSISLMPNPADNYIDLNVNSNVNVKEAMVYNAFGQMIQKVELNDNHARIDLSDMATGMYFVRVNGDNVSATKKFIKR